MSRDDFKQLRLPIAVAALLREFRDLPPEGGTIPGFRAPDDWFRDP